jgi:methionyl-tRNA formyltransferase
LKVILVTSQVLYVKDNYFSLLQKLADKARQEEGIEIVGLILVKTFSLDLIMKIIFLFFTGAGNIASALLLNVLKALFSDPRVNLFKSLNIPVINVDNINSKASIEAIKKLEPDLILNLRTRNIYKKKILSIPRIGCINVHHGILPDNRGTMCDLWAWYEDRPVGFSIHWMNRKIDDGRIILTKEVNIFGAVNYTDIPMISSKSETDALMECLQEIRDKGSAAGRENKSDNIRVTKNPNFQEIQKMRKKGLRL